MNVERTFFLIAATFALAYILLRKRRIDWYTVAAAAAALYFAPGFGGLVADPDLQRQHDIAGTTYIVFGLVFLSVGIGAVIDDLRSRSHRPIVRSQNFSRTTERVTGDGFLLLAAMSLTFSIIEMRDLVWVSQKDVAMTTYGRWMIAYEFSACAAFLTYFAAGLKRRTAVGALFILPTVFFGYRTAAVMTFIAASMIYVRDLPPQRLLRRWRYIAFALVIVYAVLLMKTIQFGLKYGLETGNWTVLTNNLSDDQLYVNAVVDSEPFVVQNTLNEVVKTGFSVGWRQLESLPAIFVPFANNLGLPSKGFNDYFQPALFSDVDYGLAANIWAQAYSLGSLSMVVVFCCVFVVGIHLISRLYARADTRSLPAIALLGAYWCFYVHRNDLLYEGLLLRRVFVIFFFGWVVIHVLNWRAGVAKSRAVLR